jgi:hypothetical protein
MRLYPAPRLAALLLAAPLLAGVMAGPAAFAQTKVKTETIEVAPVDENGNGAAAPDAADNVAREQPDVLPQVQYDLSALPPPVARTRAQIIEAAQSGDIARLRPVLEANEMPPIVSFGDDTDPIQYWKTAGGDPEGREIMAIMIEILDAGFVHVDEGTPQEMYVWPYFYALPLDSLTPSQEVELYKLITPQDREGMEEFGAYIFYRLGIGPDGTWHFFVSGD